VIYTEQSQGYMQLSIPSYPGLHTIVTSEITEVRSQGYSLRVPAAPSLSARSYSNLKFSPFFIPRPAEEIIYTIDVVNFAMEKFSRYL